LEDIVVVGGLVPSLLIAQDNPIEIEPHVGTEDLDLGLALALLDDRRYSEIAKRLRGANFKPDTKADGNDTSQRWKYDKGNVTVTLDFLMAPPNGSARGGTLQNLEEDFSAIITPGLHLAFDDCVSIELDGTTILDETATRNVQVCGVGAFIILKALAFASRGENKDAYDLYYVVRNYGDGVGDVAHGVRKHLEETLAQKALDIICENFLNIDATGPSRVADFLYRRRDDATQAEVVAWMSDLLAELSWS
jgi:hypothetical protein